LNHLAEFPETTYTSKQFSSYNRLSVAPNTPGWFANQDGDGTSSPGFEEDLGGGEYLICDVNGPGVILRMWQARDHVNPLMNGNIKAYIDNKLFYDGSATEFFKNPIITSVQNTGIDETLFQEAFVQGTMSFYFPIPFEKNCRIVWIGNPASAYFYHVLVRNYPKGTNVKTFSAEDLTDYKDEIVSVAQVLSDPKNNWQYSPQSQEVQASLIVDANQTEQILSLTGPAAIEKLTIKIDAANIEKALRQTVLRISFDGYPAGQVQSPVGDFFGSAPGINPMDTLPMIIEPDGTMTCRFLMPFKESCEIVIDNLGSQDVNLACSVSTVPYQWDEDKSMHFMARWRTDNDITAYPFNSPDELGLEDMSYLLAQGKGLYVGSAVMLYNPAPVPIVQGSWWGEGDEKIFIDDDTFPSIFGTGTEDYYGYAGSTRADAIISPYAGQSRNDGPVTRGFVSNYRWHISDPVLFREKLDFYIELMAVTEISNFYYARVAYYYARPGVIDDHVLISKDDVRYIERQPWMPVAGRGAENSIFYQAQDVITDANNIQLVSDNLWAGGQMLLWTPTVTGDKRTFDLNVTESGNYKIRITTANTPSSGIVSAYVDGTRLNFYEQAWKGNSVLTKDLFNPYRAASRTLHSPDIVLLNVGQHKVDIVYEGKSADSTGSDVGIDSLWLQKQ